MKQVSLSLSLLAAFSFSACASNYAEVTEDTSHAVVNLVNEPKLTGSKNLFGRFEQKYLSVSSAACDMPTKMAYFTSTKKDHKALRVTSDRKINIQAFNLYGGANNMTDLVTGQSSTDCNSLASFTPKKGGNYVVRLKETDNKTCEIYVVDYTTKIAPPDLAVKNSLECG